MFEQGVLPSYEPDKRHPMGWRWTYQPCAWCNYGKTCRADHKNKVTELSESHGIEFTKKIRKDYDYEASRAAVFARWDAEDPIADFIEQNS